MPTIYLVRHAQYANPRDILPGRLPVELSEEGFEESHRLSKFFKDKNISKIYSSEVLRCKQTAETISAKKIPLEFDQRLLESFSAYQGYWVNDPNLFFKHQELGGETYQDIQDRMVSFWKEKASHATENIIICSHGDPLYVLYCYLENKPIPEDFDVEKKVMNKANYLSKGGIRPVSIDSKGKVIVEKIISQEDLKS